MSSNQDLSLNCDVCEKYDEKLDYVFLSVVKNGTHLEHSCKDQTPILSVDSECNNKKIEEELLEDMFINFDDELDKDIVQNDKDYSNNKDYGGVVIEEIYSVKKTISVVSEYMGVSWHEGETILKNSLLCGVDVIKGIHNDVIEEMVDELKKIGTIAVISKEKYDNK